MIEIAVDEHGRSFTVPAEVIAAGLRLAPQQVQPLLAAGAITSWVEAGVGDDRGTFRLSFATDRRRLRLIVDALGRIINRSTVDFGGLELPPGARRPPPG